jgi:hypothetical protein
MVLPEYHYYLFYLCDMRRQLRAYSATFNVVAATQKPIGSHTPPFRSHGIPKNGCVCHCSPAGAWLTCSAANPRLGEKSQ